MFLIYQTGGGQRSVCWAEEQDGVLLVFGYQRKTIRALQVQVVWNDISPSWLISLSSVKISERPLLLCLHKLISSLWVASSFHQIFSTVLIISSGQVCSSTIRGLQWPQSREVTHLSTPGLFLRYLLMIYSRRRNEICKRHWSTGKSHHTSCLYIIITYI